MAVNPTGDQLDDARRLRKSLRQARKLAKKIRRAVAAAEGMTSAPVPGRAATREPAPTPPARWLLSGKQLHEIVTRLDLSDAGTYVKTADALGIDGDLYAMIDETFRAAAQGDRNCISKDQWLESYRNARAAYAWHLAEANILAAEEKGDTDG